jgi:hypothetical protein
MSELDRRTRSAVSSMSLHTALLWVTWSPVAAACFQALDPTDWNPRAFEFFGDMGNLAASSTTV